MLFLKYSYERIQMGVMLTLFFLSRQFVSVFLCPERQTVTWKKPTLTYAQTYSRTKAHEKSLLEAYEGEEEKNEKGE